MRKPRSGNNVDTTKISHVSLCYGYGGIDLGLHRVFGSQIRTVALCEIEAFAIENALAKMEAGAIPAAPVWNDLKSFPWGSFHGKMDILSGGFPCQPFSAAGKRQGSDDPRHLFPYILDGIRTARPSVVFLENVDGIISSKLGEGWRDPAGTPVLLHVLRELERVGYSAEAGVFSASEVGAPHQRKRVFILGVAYSDSGGSWKNIVLPKLWAIGAEQPSGSPWLLGGSGETCEVWPSRPGEPQHGWEPPRVVGNQLDHAASAGSQAQWNESYSKRAARSFGESGELAEPTFLRMEREWTEKQAAGSLQSSCARAISDQGNRKTQPPLGGNLDGPAGWLDYAELCASCDNRTDELRLLGNGVVPATAERAFRVLMGRYGNLTRFTK